MVKRERVDGLSSIYSTPFCCTSLRALNKISGNFFINSNSMTMLVKQKYVCKVESIVCNTFVYKYVY